MRMTTPLMMAAGVLLAAGAHPAAAETRVPAERLTDASAHAWTAHAEIAAVQGQGRGQGKASEHPEPREGTARGQGQGNGRAQGQGSARPQSQGQARPQSQGQGNARPQSQGQGQGEGRARGQGQGNPQGKAAAGERGRSADAAGRTAAPGRASAARGNRPDRLSPDQLRSHIADLDPSLRRLAESDRRSERMAVGAIARGKARGLDARQLDVRSENGGIRILNRSGTPLLELSEARARDLGGWEMRRMGDRRPTGNAPSFCRSGEGHPVWGRDWCIEKGFGLGSSRGTIWSRGSIDDIIFGRRDTRDRLDRGGLMDVLGDVVFGRLALHAVSMGLAEPLTGVWVAEPDSPRILRVRSGDMEIAELVDRDRDDRVEVLYVVQPRW